MKFYEKQLVNTVLDRVCDVCGNSVMIDVNGHKYQEVGELKAHWGYGSKEDGTAYHLDLCEACFRYAVSSLRELRRSTIMFDKDQEFPSEDFGIDKSRT
ncbi:hypothetical protein [Shewanella mangrovisoli]|uniref:hypothetical protein n=1 Tax=Shewanella mangrovisoli TaxID=2864211 RepID=UPI0035BAF2F3